MDPLVLDRLDYVSGLKCGESGGAVVGWSQWCARSGGIWDDSDVRPGGIGGTCLSVDQASMRLQEGNGSIEEVTVSLAHHDFPWNNSTGTSKQSNINSTLILLRQLLLSLANSASNSMLCIKFRAMKVVLLHCRSCRVRKRHTY